MRTNPINQALLRNKIRQVVKEHPEILTELYEDQRKADVNDVSLIILCLGLMALEDVFGFGKTRLQRFIDNYYTKLANLEEGLFTVDDATTYLGEKGLQLKR